MPNSYPLLRFMRRFAPSLIIALALAPLAGQSGLLLSPARYAEVPTLPDYHPGEKADEVRISVDLRPYCPVAGNQPESATCVGYAVGYGAP